MSIHIFTLTGLIAATAITLPAFASEPACPVLEGTYHGCTVEVTAADGEKTRGPFPGDTLTMSQRMEGATPVYTSSAAGEVVVSETPRHESLPTGVLSRMAFCEGGKLVLSEQQSIERRDGRRIIRLQENSISLNAEGHLVAEGRQKSYGKGETPAHGATLLQDIHIRVVCQERE